MFSFLCFYWLQFTWSLQSPLAQLDPQATSAYPAWFTEPCALVISRAQCSPGSSCRVLGFPQPHFTTHLNSAITGKGLLVRARASAALGTELSELDDSIQPSWWFFRFCHTLHTTDSPVPALHPRLEINVNI